uniref:Uncharacterized protein n=1 Tax=Nelumbo nucifera TaxID=4432 RepID=A0A822YEM3_NELNU|nr:TPA_asm: hypothetical protein HUJ06_031167 [Nelumbo nucifera]
MRGHVDQANVNVHLSVFNQTVLVWNTDKRASFLRFCFPWRAPSSNGGNKTPAVHQRQQGDLRWRRVLLLIFFSSPFLFFSSSSSSPVVGPI